MHLTEYKQRVLPRLKQSLEMLNKKFMYQSKSFYENDLFIFNELNTLIAEGKYTRGLLTILSADSYGEPDNEIVYELAALVEYAHLALLIHDDVMDQSNLRRGTLSAPARFSAILDGHGAQQAKSYGDAVALALGDAMFFFILDQVLSLPCHNSKKQSLLNHFTKILYVTARGQVFDVVAGIQQLEYDDIIHLYETKTAQYSFFLPLALGLELPEVEFDELEMIELLSKQLGLILQIKDDLQSFNGDYQDLSQDVSGNKAMLWRWYMENAASRKEKERLRGIFGSEIIFPHDLNLITNLFEKYQIRDHLKSEIDKHTKIAHSLVQYLSVRKKERRLLHEFINLI